jgi:hypothetical protein
MTAIYRDVMSTLVRVLAADNIDNTTKQHWQNLIDSMPADSTFRSCISAREKFDYDCALYALLHRELKPLHWNLLVGKYSTHKGNKVAAIGKVAPHVESFASELFKFKATTAWFIPKMKGLQAQASTGLEVVSRAERQYAEHKALMASFKKKGIKGMSKEVDREKYIKRSTDMIVLKPEFYDMNTWDSEARPESTRRRWRNQVYRSLDAIEEAALIHVTEIFDQQEIFGQVA